MFSRLFGNSPQTSSSAIDSAICAVASVTRKRAAAFAPDGWPAFAFSADTRLGRVTAKSRRQPEQDAGRQR